jgi:hypothetical protein
MTEDFKSVGPAWLVRARLVEGLVNEPVIIALMIMTSTNRRENRFIVPPT